MSQTQAWYIDQRGELLAREFLLTLGTNYIASLTDTKTGLDYVAIFAAPSHPTKVVAVEVKATEKEINNRFPVDISLLKSLVNINIPSLLLVADVKRNLMFFNWLRDMSPDELTNLMQGRKTETGEARRVSGPNPSDANQIG